MDSTEFWPPEPLVLGNRIFHWACWNVVINEIVVTARFSQLHLTDISTNESFVLKSNEFLQNEVAVGHHLSLLGLGDQALTAGRYTRVAWLNNDAGGWGMFDFWEKQHFSDEHCMARFGLPKKRKIARNLFETYSRALCGVCLQIKGYTGSELSHWTEKNVQIYIKRQF